LRLQVRWIKQRVTTASPSRWADILVWLAVDGDNGHICEVQIVFETFMAARPTTEADVACAALTDAIERIEATGQKFTRETPQSTASLAASNAKLREEVARQHSACEVLARANAELVATCADLNHNLSDAIHHGHLSSPLPTQSHGGDESQMVRELIGKNQRLTTQVIQTSADLQRASSDATAHEKRAVGLSLEVSALKRQLQKVGGRSEYTSPTAIALAGDTEAASSFQRTTHELDRSVQDWQAMIPPVTGPDSDV
jgi:phage shock protein A